jgi:hypothetical protein
MFFDVVCLRQVETMAVVSRATGQEDYHTRREDEAKLISHAGVSSLARASLKLLRFRSMSETENTVVRNVRPMFTRLAAMITDGTRSDKNSLWDELNIKTRE